MELTKEEKLVKLKERIEEASRDPVVFIDHFLYTFNPKVEPYHFPFRLFPFQVDLVKSIKEAIERGYDLFIEKCREMGATYCVLDTFLWFWRYIPGSNFLLGSRKEQYVDNTKGEAGGVSNKEESLFGKLEYTLNKFYPFMLPKGFDIKKHMTYMSLVNPENGNVITGESSNPSFSRGGRNKAILLDEFAFWENGASAWGATADTTNCRIVLTTPGTGPSKAKRLRFGKDGEKIKIITLNYNLDPRKTLGWLKKEKERRSAEDFAREIMINWESSEAGRVYPEVENCIVGEFPYNWKWPFYVSWDFGLDGVAIQWWQLNMDTGKPRLVDAYYNVDKPIQWYLPFFAGCDVDSNFSYDDDALALMNVVGRWKKAIHYGDPDVSKRSLLTGTTTRQELQNHGIYVQTNVESNDFASRREKTKVLLQKGIEVNKTKGTDFWMDCIKESRYPQRQETSQATTPVALPIHDYNSHHRTALEYFAVNFDPISANEIMTTRNIITQEDDPSRNLIEDDPLINQIF